MNEDSILHTVMKLSGLSFDYDAFETDMLVAINGLIPTLRQLGVKVPKDFRVESEDDEWEDMLGTDVNLDLVKAWLSYKVRLQFDPPTNSALLTSLKEIIAEYEWRINVYAD